MSAYVGTCVFVALLGDGKCMMMSANGDDSVCFPCLSKCECPVPYFVRSSFHICFYEVLNVRKPFSAGHSPAVEWVRVYPLRIEGAVFKSIDTYQKMLNN